MPPSPQSPEGGLGRAPSPIQEGFIGSQPVDDAGAPPGVISPIEQGVPTAAPLDSGSAPLDAPPWVLCLRQGQTHAPLVASEAEECRWEMDGYPCGTHQFYRDGPHVPAECRTHTRADGFMRTNCYALCPEGEEETYGRR
jgi:hypothetical protein